mgnify:CR=1 FL=1
MLERNVGAVKLTVNQMIKQLSNAYVSLIKSEVSLKSFPSVMGGLPEWENHKVSGRALLKYLS